MTTGYFGNDMLLKKNTSVGIKNRDKPKNPIDDHQVFMTMDVQISRKMLIERQKNIDNGNKATEEYLKKWNNPFREGSSEISLSYFPDVLDFRWKNPKNDASLHTDIPFDPTNPLSYNTVPEALLSNEDMSCCLQTFNGLSMDSFVKKFDKFKDGREDDVYTFNTSDDLMAAIDVIGMRTDANVFIWKGKLQNSDDTKFIVQSTTERFRKSLINIANSGPKAKKQDRNKEAIFEPGNPQTLSISSRIIWYFPEFDNKDPSKAMLLKKKTGKKEYNSSTSKVEDTYTYEINESFLKAWRLSFPLQRKNENRYELLWKRYDEYEETLNMDIAAKAHIIPSIYGIGNEDKRNKEIKNLFGVLPGDLKKRLEILTSKLNEDIKKFGGDGDDKNKFMLEEFVKIHKEIIKWVSRKKILEEKRIIMRVDRGKMKVAPKDDKSIMVFFSTNEIKC
jgi:hypothetical protein